MRLVAALALLLFFALPTASAQMQGAILTMDVAHFDNSTPMSPGEARQVDLVVSRICSTTYVGPGTADIQVKAHPALLVTGSPTVAFDDQVCAMDGRQERLVSLTITLAKPVVANGSAPEMLLVRMLADYQGSGFGNYANDAVLDLVVPVNATQPVGALATQSAGSEKAAPGAPLVALVGLVGLAAALLRRRLA